ncbi:hypothetical protein PoB_002533100 [Plakobranchus ocellatus]|uniref:Uncharacterized protein n=1 Tax=Plakobranchus ocellatus TaxID=259542 RepID=A0AAV3ZI67_9GAST|nr:hypothetical protein PoB_002533100 [Plakobranchus ocellatus]
MSNYHPPCSPITLESWSDQKEKKRNIRKLWFVFCVYSVHNKVISGFQVLRQARALMAGLEPATCNRRIPADIRADLLATVPPTPPQS